MLLVVDNGSVYTPSLLNCLTELNLLFKHHLFSEIDSVNIENFSSIILSGRRTNNLQMNVINSKIVSHCTKFDISLLGICYGAEIIALTLGGTIKKMNKARHGLYDIDVIEKNPLCGGIIKGFESHSYSISKLIPDFLKIASSSECEFEIFQYGNKNIFGTQFHPEMSLDGKSLLKNFSSIK